MTDTQTRRPARAEDLMVKARDARNEALARMCRAIFTAPAKMQDAAIVKCYLEPMNQDKAEARKPSDREAANPLLIRGLQVG